jgi:hypothetical protein
VPDSPGLVRTLLKLLAVVLLGFLVYWGIDNAFIHSEPVAGTKMVIRTQIGDDGRSLPVARRAAHEATHWLREVFGLAPSERTDIRLARSGNCQWIENLVGSEQSTAWSGSGGICVYTGRPLWKRLLKGDGGRNAEEVVVHELIHTAQRELGCVDEPGHQRFLWLVEGMAVYGAREALILSGRRRAEETGSYIRREGGYGPGLGPLERYETRGDSAAYQLWHRAVRRLADAHGGVGALRGFCAEVGTGREWRAAFADAFGLSPAAFYAEFERSRR